MPFEPAVQVRQRERSGSSPEVASGGTPSSHIDEVFADRFLLEPVDPDPDDPETLMQPTPRPMPALSAPQPVCEEGVDYRDPIVRFAPQMSLRREGVARLLRRGSAEAI